MIRKHPCVTAAALAAAALAASPAQAGLLRLVPGPLAGTALAIGGLAASGTALTFLARRRCKADPACAAEHGLVPTPPRPRPQYR